MDLFFPKYSMFSLHITFILICPMYTLVYQDHVCIIKLIVYFLIFYEPAIICYSALFSPINGEIQDNTQGTFGCLLLFV